MACGAKSANTAVTAEARGDGLWVAWRSEQAWQGGSGPRRSRPSGDRVQDLHIIVRGGRSYKDPRGGDAAFDDAAKHPRVHGQCPPVLSPGGGGISEFERPILGVHCCISITLKT